MTDTNTQEVETYGRITWQGDKYELLIPHPVQIDTWHVMEGLLGFYVAPFEVSVSARIFKPRHIVVHPSQILIDYGFAGRKIKIETVEKEAVQPKIDMSKVEIDFGT